MSRQSAKNKMQMLWIEFSLNGWLFVLVCVVPSKARSKLNAMIVHLQSMVVVLSAEESRSLNLPVTCKSEDRTITDSLRRNYNHNMEAGSWLARFPEDWDRGKYYLDVELWVQKTGKGCLHSKRSYFKRRIMNQPPTKPPLLKLLWPPQLPQCHPPQTQFQDHRGQGTVPPPLGLRACLVTCTLSLTVSRVWLRSRGAGGGRSL